MSKKNAVKKLKQDDVGKICLVRWDDLGRVDTMLVQVDDDGLSGQVFSFADSSLNMVCVDQIVEVGNMVTPNSLLYSQCVYSQCEK